VGSIRIDDPAALGDIVDASCVSLSSSTFVCLATQTLSGAGALRRAAFLAISFMLFLVDQPASGFRFARQLFLGGANLGVVFKSDWLLMVPANGSKAVCEPFQPKRDWPGDTG